MFQKLPRIARGALAVIPMLALAATLQVRAADAPPPADDHFGVLVMAHGGSPTWEQGVTAALKPLHQEFPVEIAYGMADAASLQRGVEALQAQGVQRIGVVRLFISGESWYDRTQQIFGLEPGAPPKPQPAADDPHAGHAGHGGHSMEFWRVQSTAQFAMSHDGLADATQMGGVLADRAHALSRDPAHEVVLILAHGPGDDAENARWVQKIDARADAVRKASPFHDVRVMTLREDWPDKRAAAERMIRDYLEQAKTEGMRAIVIPYRVQGFGPYADVLKGLDYTADGVGLVPSPQVADWVREQAIMLRDHAFGTGQK